MTSPDIEQACLVALKLRRRSTEALRRRIYLNVYAARWDGMGVEPGARPAPAMDRSFVASLTREIPDVATVAGGILTETTDDNTLLEIDGIRASAMRDQVVEAPRVGRPATLSLPALLSWRIPGFVSRITFQRLPNRASRIYLNITPPQARWVLGDIAHALASAGIPYFMKVLAHPSRYYRTDAGLVMVSAEDERITLDTIQRSDGLRDGRLGSSTPLFTKGHAAGIGVADDPDDVPEVGGRRLSHGEWVRSLLLDAIEQTDNAATAAASVAGSIRNIGRDPARPYRRGRWPRRP